MHPDPDIQLQQFALSHGQVRGVLGELGLRSGDSEAQFDAWLKYVRRKGMPFYPNQLGRGARVNVIYRFHHVMELAVALALRTQGILPLDLLTLLMQEAPGPAAALLPGLPPARLWPWGHAHPALRRRPAGAVRLSVATFSTCISIISRAGP